MKTFREYLDEAEDTKDNYSGIGFRPGQKKTAAQERDIKRRQDSHDEIQSMATKIAKKKRLLRYT